MPIPIIILVAIPVFLGIVYMPPFDMPQQVEPEVEPTVPKEPGMSILFFMMMVIWIIFLVRIMIKLKKGTFRVTQRY